MAGRSGQQLYEVFPMPLGYLALPLPIALTWLSCALIALPQTPAWGRDHWETLHCILCYLHTVDT